MTPRPTLVFSRPDPAAAKSDHRIAESLSAVAGLVRIQAARIRKCGRSLDSEETRTILAELGSRIDAAACLRRRLADRPDEAIIEVGEYLQDISAAVVAALCQDRVIRLQFARDGRCLLPPEQALKIGFIVVELVTNAVKYAHPTGVPGDVAVTCSHGRDGTVTVEVSDDGVGLPEGLNPMEADTLGLQLVRSLAAQLDARLGFANNGLGLSCVLQVPEIRGHDLVELPPATVRRTTMTPKNYRCYFTDAGDRIRSYEEIACADDSAAALKVDELLATSRYSSAELWQGKRLVGKWSVNGPANGDSSK